MCQFAAVPSLNMIALQIYKVAMAIASESMLTYDEKRTSYLDAATWCRIRSRLAVRIGVVVSLAGHHHKTILRKEPKHEKKRIYVD